MPAITTTIAPIVGVDPALQLAFNANPESVLLTGLMSDSARENGYLMTADCLRWLWLSELLPACFGIDDYGWHWSSVNDEGPIDRHSIPYKLMELAPPRDNLPLPTEAVYRVIIGWSRASEKQREWWKLWTTQS